MIGQNIVIWYKMTDDTFQQPRWGETEWQSVDDANKSGPTCDRDLYNSAIYMTAIYLEYTVSSCSLGA